MFNVNAPARRDTTTIESHYKRMASELAPIRKELQQGLDTIEDSMKLNMKTKAEILEKEEKIKYARKVRELTQPLSKRTISSQLRVLSITCNERNQLIACDFGDSPSRCVMSDLVATTIATTSESFGPSEWVTVCPWQLLETTNRGC